MGLITKIAQIMAIVASGIAVIPLEKELVPEILRFPYYFCKIYFIFAILVMVVIGSRTTKEKADVHTP